MHLKQLEAFVSVAKLGSFSRAAEAVYLTQPTISAHISALERELGAKLIIRSTKEVYLSAAGKIFYDFAVEILKLCDQAAQEVRSFCTEIGGTLSIAASTVPSQYILPKVLSVLAGRYPQIFFQVAEFDSTEVVEKVLHNGADIGIVGAAISEPGCEYTPFVDDKLVIIAPNREEYRALEGQLTPEQLKGLPFVVREAGSGTWRRSKEFLTSVGIEEGEISTVAQFKGTQGVMQAVINGLGISIVSSIAAEHYVKTGDLLVFDFDSEYLQRKFYLVHRKNYPLTPAARAFISALENWQD